MSLHVFGNIVTHHGTASNNRGETEGNLTTLQKIIWLGQVHSTVSAEAIRFALRRRMLEDGQELNRAWDEDARANVWQDASFTDVAKFMDSDLLGFMSAEAAKEENSGEDGAPAKSRARPKGKATVRRSVLEVTRAVSLTPWPGDVAFGAASPGATPSAAKKGTNPAPYSAELHATRYQYGFAITPERLKEANRAVLALGYLASLGPVAGNHARFLFDFSPDSMVLRITQDPSPRILYCFSLRNGEPCLAELLRRVQSGDIRPSEVVVGGAIAATEEARKLKELGTVVEGGVMGAVKTAITKIPSSTR